MDCDNCGKPNDRGVIYCSDCGYKLGQDRSSGEIIFNRDQKRTDTTVYSSRPTWSASADKSMKQKSQPRTSSNFSSKQPNYTQHRSSSGKPGVIPQQSTNEHPNQPSAGAAIFAVFAIFAAIVIFGIGMMILMINGF